MSIDLPILALQVVARVVRLSVDGGHGLLDEESIVRAAQAGATLCGLEDA